MHHPGIRPPLRRSGLKPPMSNSADQVGVQVQAFPTYSIPPGPGNTRCHPHHPLTIPRRSGLSRSTPPPSSTCAAVQQGKTLNYVVMTMRL